MSDKKTTADKITDYLFSNGARGKARRLVLEMEDGSNGGGWGREPVRDAISDHIEPLTNELHRLCSAILSGADEKAIKKYARRGLTLLADSDPSPCCGAEMGFSTCKRPRHDGLDEQGRCGTCGRFQLLICLECQLEVRLTKQANNE